MDDFEIKTIKLAVLITFVTIIFIFISTNFTRVTGACYATFMTIITHATTMIEIRHIYIYNEFYNKLKVNNSNNNFIS